MAPDLRQLEQSDVVSALTNKMNQFFSPINESNTSPHSSYLKVYSNIGVDILGTIFQKSWHLFHVSLISSYASNRTPVFIFRIKNVVGGGAQYCFENPNNDNLANLISSHAWFSGTAVSTLTRWLIWRGFCDRTPNLILIELAVLILFSASTSLRSKRLVFISLANVL